MTDTQLTSRDEVMPDQRCRHYRPLGKKIKRLKLFLAHPTFSESKMKKLLFALVLFASHSANAAYEFTGLIKTIYLGPVYAGKVFIQVDGTPTGTVSCDNAVLWDYVFDASTADGKIYLSTLLAAYTAGKTVGLISTNDCNVYAEIPTLQTIWLK